MIANPRPTSIIGYETEVERQVAAAAAVSFDFFDTLFVRPLLDPEDAFDLLGNRFGIRNFRRMRRAAQAAAFRRMRASGRREITLEEIYACFDPLAVSSAELMRAEYEFELSLVQPNSELIGVFERIVASGKQVVLTSDMYLPTHFFSESFRRHGLPEVPMFISADRNATKRDSGELFDVVAGELGLAPNSILHIGDNPLSDIRQARAKGLTTFHYTEQRRPPALHTYMPEASLARGLLRRHGSRIEAGSLRELGFLYGGPAAIGFLDWIVERARGDGIDHVLFLARDGYIIDRIARECTDLLLPQSSYFLGSRTVFAMAAMTAKNFADYLPFLLSGAQGLSPVELLERINVPAPSPRVMEDFGLGATAFVTEARKARLAEFLYAYRWEILKVCRRNRQSLLLYLKSLGLRPGSRVALVDAGWNGTTQDAFECALQNLLDLEVFGYYLCLADTPECRQRQQTRRMAALFSTASANADLVAKIYENRVAVELFFSAPHPSIFGLTTTTDGRIVAMEDSGRGENNNLLPASAEISAGMLEFAVSYHQLRRELCIPTSPLGVAMPLIEFVTRPGWDNHPLLSSMKNFDSWSSTRNRDAALAEYIRPQG
jgi:predicted HAD superfamily hydrolase